MVLQEVFSFSLGGDEVDDFDVGAPLFELVFPVGDHSLGYDHHKVAIDLLILSEESQKGNRLNRLAQTLNR